nr:MAG TPA: hypothetical protein [Caudoviricetes sp.]
MDDGIVFRNPVRRRRVHRHQNRNVDIREVQRHDWCWQLGCETVQVRSAARVLASG